MPIFKRLQFNLARKQKKTQPVANEVGIREILNQQLAPYMKQEDVLKLIKKIESDKEKKKIWDSLSTLKKIKLLRYLSSKREATSGK